MNLPELAAALAEFHTNLKTYPAFRPDAVAWAEKMEKARGAIVAGVHTTPLTDRPGFAGSTRYQVESAMDGVHRHLNNITGLHGGDAVACLRTIKTSFAAAAHEVHFLLNHNRQITVPRAGPVPVAEARRGGAVTRRKRQSDRPRRVTPIQAETVQIVGECKGNFAQAAQRMGKDRKTVQQSYKAGLRNVHLTPSALKPKMQNLPHDRRGQALVNDDD